MIRFPKMNKRHIVFLCILIAVYVGMQFLFGIRIAPDSKKYINGSPLVGPGYPLYLDIAEALFGRGFTVQGQPAFLFFAVLIQNVFLAWALFSLLCHFEERAGLSVWECALLSGGFIAASLLQVVFTSEGRITSNTVMSEGLAVPLYYLFFKYYHAACADKDGRPLLTAALFGWLAVNCRGQLMFLLILLVIASLRIPFLMKNGKKIGRSIKALLLCGCAAVFLLGSMLFTRVYNRTVTGTTRGNALARIVLLGAQMYTAGPEDAELFEPGSPEREIFDTTMTEMRREGYRSTEAAPGIYTEFMHYEWACDPIQRRVRETGEAMTANGMEPDALDSAYTRMIAALFFRNAGRFLRHYAINVFGGLVRSAAIFTPAFNIAVTFLYAGCIALLLYARGKKYCICGKTALACVLLSILLNALFTSFGVWCLSRYMYYNLPMLYLCLWVLLRELIVKKKDAVQTGV